MKRTIISILLALIPVAIFLILQTVVGSLLAVICIALHIDYNGEGLVYALFAANLAIIITMLILRKITGQSIIGEIKPERVKWNLAPIAILATMAGIFATDIWQEQLNLPNLMETQFNSLSRNPLGIFAIAVIGPIAEEIVFRGEVLGGMMRRGTNKWTAIIVSALLFGLIHLNPAQVPFATVVGVMLGILYVKSRSLIPSSILHIINNSLSVLLMNTQFGQSDTTWTDIIGSPLAVNLLAVALAIAAIRFYFWYWKNRNKKNIVKS